MVSEALISSYLNSNASERVVRVTVTPELASEILKSNTRNRNLRETAVDKLSAVLRNGEWKFNGEAIQISKSGTLLNGQHRLTAVVRTGISIDTIIVFGMDESSQETMDFGSKRSVADILKFRGYKNVTNLVSLASSLALYRKTGSLTTAIWKNVPQTPAEIVKFVEDHPELAAEALEAVSIGQKLRLSIKPVGLARAAMFDVDSEDAAYFWRRIIDPVGLDFDSPFLAFRDWALNPSRVPSSTQNATKEQVAILIKAWNKFRQGEPCQRLYFRSGGSNPEKFPEAI